VPGLASTLPVVVQRSIQRIAVEAPILRSRAASRALSPASTIANTRTLRSLEYPFAIAAPASAVGSIRIRFASPRESRVTLLIHIKRNLEVYSRSRAPSQQLAPPVSAT